MPAPSFLDRLLHPLGRKHTAAEDLAFGPDFLAQLERLRIATLKALGGGLREGHRLGAYKGGQLEFHGHRDYSPGDELRYLDWNGYARLGRPYIKEFAREESGVLHILLDASASMRLGEPAKFTFARRVAALFAHVALASRDAAHLLVFGRGLRAEHFPARQARANSQAFMAFLQQLHCDAENDGAAREPQPGSENVLAHAVSEFLKRAPKRGGVLLLGDFWQEEAELAASVSRLAQAGFDVSAIHTLAHEELDPPGRGELLTHSIEDGAETTLYFGTELSERYRTEVQRHCTTVEAIFRKRGGNYLFAQNDTALEKVLIAALRQRRWLR